MCARQAADVGVQDPAGPTDRAGQGCDGRFVGMGRVGRQAGFAPQCRMAHLGLSQSVSSPVLTGRHRGVLVSQDEANQLWHVQAVKNTSVEYYWLDAGWFNGGFPNGVGNWEIPLNKCAAPSPPSPPIPPPPPPPSAQILGRKSVKVVAKMATTSSRGCQVPTIAPL